ncbi:CaiB/BaiF CoA transferase family protein [Blastococcus sp. SYSU DS0533]
MADRPGHGPLAGLRVLEMAGLGPVPHAAMMLADLGADVVRVGRPGPRPMAELAGAVDHVLRGRTDTTADLKSPDGLTAVRALAARADVLLEGFRPGVMERLGLGPAELLAADPGLVYGRMTGWGHQGPLALSAGHDLNYLAVTGVLHALGPADQPPPVPLTLLGDYGGGSMFLVTGVLAALWERARSGRGQVVDAAMVDGIGVLAQKFWAMRGAGTWTDDRHANLLDGAAPFYDTYVCADGRHLAVAAIERPFFARLMAGLGLDPAAHGDQYDRAAWPQLRTAIERAVCSRTRDEWAVEFDGTDACASPVLTFAEALEHAHHRARDAFVEIDGVPQPAPAPRFDRTPPPTPAPPGSTTVPLEQAVLLWSTDAR